MMPLFKLHSHLLFLALQLHFFSAHVLQGYQMSGSVRVSNVLPSCAYNKISMHGRKLGHLSAVYCVLFDRTGNYIFTVCHKQTCEILLVLVTKPLRINFALKKNMWFRRGSNTDQPAHEPLPAETFKLLEPSFSRSNFNQTIFNIFTYKT